MASAPPPARVNNRDGTEPLANFESARPDAAPLPWVGNDPAFNANTNYYVQFAPAPVVKAEGQSAPPPAVLPPTVIQQTPAVQYILQPPVQPAYTIASPGFQQVYYVAQPTVDPPPPPPAPPAPREIQKSYAIGSKQSKSIEVIQLNNSSRDIIEKFWFYAPSPSAGQRVVSKFLGDGYTPEGTWTQSDLKNPDFAYVIILSKSFKGIPGCSADAEPSVLYVTEIFH